MEFADPDADFRDSTGREIRVPSTVIRENVRRGFGGFVLRSTKLAPHRPACAWTRTRARVHRVKAIGRVRRSDDRRDHARSIAV